MKKKLLQIILTTGIVGSLFSCGSGNKISTEELMAEIDSINSSQSTALTAVNQEAINGIIQSIPSPLEISFLIKESGGDYNKSFLNPTSNVSKYQTSHKKALNLGIYGADLAYSNIYGKSQEGIVYLDAVRKLADELSIGQFFDLKTLSKLIRHNNNLDSLLLITTSNFEKINLYLQEQNRSQLSVLLLTGGWIEGLSLLNHVYAKNQNDLFAERIGEQKIVLEQLLTMLEYFKHDSYIKSLLDDLKPLNDVFDDITIETIEGEMSFEEVGGVMMIVNNSSTHVNITKEQLNKIELLTAQVRKNIIN